MRLEYNYTDELDCPYKKLCYEYGNEIICYTHAHIDCKHYQKRRKAEDQEVIALEDQLSPPRREQEKRIKNIEDLMEDD